MRAVDFDELLTVAHLVDDGIPLAKPTDLGIELAPPRGFRAAPALTACGLEVGRTWVDASPYPVPDCADCAPSGSATKEEALW